MEFWSFFAMLLPAARRLSASAMMEFALSSVDVSGDVSVACLSALTSARFGGGAPLSPVAVLKGSRECIKVVRFMSSLVYRYHGRQEPSTLASIMPPAKSIAKKQILI
jgi:hypothetical protein